MAAKRNRQPAGKRVIVEHSDAARYASALPKRSRIRQFVYMKDSRRRRARVIEPIDHRCRRHLPADSRSAVRPPRLEPMGGTDVIEIQERSLIMLARACFHPPVLLGTPTSSVDSQAHARAGREIEHVSRPTKREFFAAPAVCPEETIRDECTHPIDAYVQSARPQKRAETRGALPKQCRKFV
jgi:hypothetical protein